MPRIIATITPLRSTSNIVDKRIYDFEFDFGQKSFKKIGNFNWMLFLFVILMFVQAVTYVQLFSIFGQISI